MIMQTWENWLIVWSYIVSYKMAVALYGSIFKHILGYKHVQ